MSDAQRLVGRGEIESQPVGDEDAVPSSRLSTHSDRRGQEELHHAPNDRLWAFAAKLNVAITVFSAVYFLRAAWGARTVLFQMAVPAVPAVPAVLGYMLGSKGQGSSGYFSDMGAIVFTCVLVISIAYWLSWEVLRVTASSARLLVEFAILLFVLLCVGAVPVVAMFGSTLGVAVYTIVCAVVVKFLFLRRGRVDFVAATLKVAALAVISTPRVRSWALCATAVRMAWGFVALIASVGSVFAFQTVRAPDGTTYRAVDCYNVAPWGCECNGDVISETSGCEHSNPNPFLVLFWVVSSMWANSTFGNVMDATVAGSVATWWSSPGNVETAWVSLDRVLRSSLGSVSKAAVIPVIFHSLTYLVGHVLEAISVTSLLLSGVRVGVNYTLKTPVRAAVTYMTENTAIVIGMYRLSFSEAARRLWALFRKIGLALFINEVLLGMALALIVLVVVIFAFVVLILEFRLVSPHHVTVVLVVYGAGLLAIQAMLDVVKSAFKAVCICFLQEPESFSSSHDRWLYEAMYRAWREMRLPHPTMAEEQEQIEL